MDDTATRHHQVVPSCWGKKKSSHGGRRLMVVSAAIFCLLFLQLSRFDDVRSYWYSPFAPVFVDIVSSSPTSVMESANTTPHLIFHKPNESKRSFLPAITTKHEPLVAAVVHNRTSTSTTIEGKNTTRNKNRGLDEKVLQEIIRRYPSLAVLDPIIEFQEGEEEELSCPRDFLEEFRQSTIPWSSSKNQEARRNDCDLPEMLRTSTDPYDLRLQNNQKSSTNTACPVFSFDHHAACEMVSSHNSEHDNMTILFVGSSVIRQLVVALGITLTGNMVSGGIRYLPPTRDDSQVSETWRRLCACQNQWGCYKPIQEMDGKYMHRFDNSFSFQNVENLCDDDDDDDHHPNNKTKNDPEVAHAPPPYQILYHRMYHGPLITKELKAIAMNIRQKKKIVIVSDATALAGGLDIAKTKGFLNDLLGLFPNNKVLLIPMTVHNVGKNKKPIRWSVVQGRAMVEAYNEQLRAWSREHDKNNNLKVLDTYNLTKFQESQDGTHYLTFNVALSQILLNYIARYAIN